MARPAWCNTTGMNDWLATRSQPLPIWELQCCKQGDVGSLQVSWVACGAGGIWEHWENRLNTSLPSFTVTLALCCSGSTSDWQSEGVGSSTGECNILFWGGCWNDGGNGGYAPSGGCYQNNGHHSIDGTTSNLILGL